jgi:hypothetical protein
LANPQKGHFMALLVWLDPIVPAPISRETEAMGRETKNIQPIPEIVTVVLQHPEIRRV